MEAVYLEDQMLQRHLLQQKKGSKWLIKLFERFLNTAIQNSMIIQQSMKIRKGTHN
jgi:hypothetical protein